MSRLRSGLLGLIGRESKIHKHLDSKVDSEFDNLYTALVTARSKAIPVGIIVQYVLPNLTSVIPEEPEGWKVCNGQELDGSKYTELYRLLGFRFGGKPAQQTFSLPNIAPTDGRYSLIKVV